MIARAHYRGQVKRRMQRFRTGSPRTLDPGERVQLPDGRIAQVVMASPDDTGQQFLAVTPLVPASGSAEPGDTDALPDCEALALPYTLPQ